MSQFSSLNNISSKRRRNKLKKSDSELIQEFWIAPVEAFFGQETIAPVTNVSPKTLECNRWRKSGIPFRKIGGRVLYRKADVIAWLDSFDVVDNTSQYANQEAK